MDLVDFLFFIEVLVGGLLSGIMYSLVALGLVLIFKASSIFNFAQGRPGAVWSADVRTADGSRSRLLAVDGLAGGWSGRMRRSHIPGDESESQRLCAKEHI